MSVSYVSRKCSCGGKLQYDKSRKIWLCLYCGAEVERTERYDTLFTIKNVVRQTLLDIAYRRLDNAEKNLTECEKIDSRYVGTIIANLCFLMIKVSTPGACTETEAKNILSKLKRYKDLLESEHGSISEEEEALYDFFDSSDVFATLVVVYDSLNDTERRDFVKQFVKPEDIFSFDTNKNLFSFSIINQESAFLEGIIRNSDNIDKKFALSEVLDKYPDGAPKVESVEILFSKNAYGKEDRDLIETYLRRSNDSPATKATVVCLALASDIRITTSVILQSVLANNQDIAVGNEVLEKVCGCSLSDEELNEIIEFCLSCMDEEAALAGLKIVRNTNKFVALGHKAIMRFLEREGLSWSAKVNILTQAYEFDIDAKTKEVVAGDYLNENKDNPENRLGIMDFLLTTTNKIPTSSFVDYVLNNNVDGANKPVITQKILDISGNTSFYYDILSKYIFTNSDEPSTKEQIVIQLLDKGIKIDPEAFSKYVCSEADSMSKASIVKKMLANGSTLKPNTLSNYLTDMQDFTTFDPELFALLLQASVTIADSALCNYILYCKDHDSVKIQNTLKLAKMTPTPFGNQVCTVQINGSKIKCNLLQGYLLCVPDNYQVANEIVREMVKRKAKIISPIFVSGKQEKFKKYISANSDVSTLTEQLCQENKLFNIFA